MKVQNGGESERAMRERGKYSADVADDQDVMRLTCRFNARSDDTSILN